LREEPPESVLLERARAGDDRALEVLCERHREQVWRIAASVARGADAEDLAQEVILKAYRSLTGYRGAAPFGAWLCRIAVNAAHDQVRSAWRRRVLLFGDLGARREEQTQDGPEHGVTERETQRQVRQAVARLPERQRVPIWLHYFEGYSLAEVARLERLPEATVRSRVRAGLRTLSRVLSGAAVETGEAVPKMVPQQKGCQA